MHFSGKWQCSTLTDMTAATWDEAQMAYEQAAGWFVLNVRNVGIRWDAKALGGMDRS